MKLSQKQIDYLDKKVKAKFGTDFDTFYHLIEKQLENKSQTEKEKK